MSFWLLVVVVLGLGCLAALVSVYIIGRRTSPVGEALTRPRGRLRRLALKAAPALSVVAFSAGGFVLFAYPAIFPDQLEPPAVETDPAEGKVWLDSAVVIELRGSFSRDDVLEGLQIRPHVEIDEGDIRIEKIAAMPFNNGMPWATTRVTLNASRAPLFAPGTEYEVAVRHKRIVFETITVPEVVRSVVASGSASQDVPTSSEFTITFNKAIVWRDEYLSVEPDTDLVLEASLDRRGRTVVTGRPTTRYENSTAYSVTVHPGIRDEHNHSGGSTHTFSFTTWPQPVVVSATPAGVTQPVDLPVRIEFQRAPMRATAESSFTVDPPIPGVFEWESDTALLWRPSANLPFSTEYAASVAGLAQGGDSFVPHAWPFRTQDPPVAVEIKGGTVGPTILEAAPAGGLGSFTYEWSTGETDRRILVNVAHGETRTIELRVSSGDQAVVKAVQVAGPAAPRAHIAVGCADGWDLVAVSICFRKETLPGPTDVFLARIDTRDPDLEITSSPAADTLGARRTVSEAAISGGALIAINADFFHQLSFGTVPVGPVIRDGSIAQLDWKFNAAFAFSRDGRAWAAAASDAYIGLSGAAGLVQAQHVNGLPPDGEIALFNGYWGSSLTLPFEACYATLVPTSLYEMSPLDFACGAVSGVPLPANRVVVIARGSAAAWLEGSIASSFTLVDPLGLLGLDFLVGGSDALIHGGQPQPFGPAHAAAGPRSAIGVDAAGFTYLVVADGRRADSAGLTLSELQTYLQGLGLVEAINLDGGGSAQMALSGVIINQPSDGRERPVASIIEVTRPRPDCGHPLVRC